MAETVVTIGIVCLDMVGIINVNEVNEIRNFIYEWEIGFSGKSSVYSAYYKEFSKTSPCFYLMMHGKLKNGERLQLHC